MLQPLIQQILGPVPQNQDQLQPSTVSCCPVPQKDPPVHSPTRSSSTNPTALPSIPPDVGTRSCNIRIRSTGPSALPIIWLPVSVHRAIISSPASHEIRRYVATAHRHGHRRGHRRDRLWCVRRWWVRPNHRRGPPSGAALPCPHRRGRRPARPESSCSGVVSFLRPPR